MIRALLLVLSLWSVAGATPLEEAFRAAVANPFDPDKFDAFASLLPVHEERYVVDGDMLLTREQLRGYLLEHGAPAAPPPGELIVNVTNGTRDRWPAGKRALTFRVIPEGFGDRAATIETQLVQAGDAWSTPCPDCGFTLAKHTGPGRPTFEVRHVTGAPFVAAAFFPSSPPVDRVLQIDDSFFTAEANPVGVLRHEIGHVLGYRHEHIKGVPGCRREGGTWSSLTPYDGTSVMHYLCGGAGTPALELSPLDVSGHRRHYLAE